RRLKPGAPLVLAGNHRRYADHPRLLDAWQQRWRMKGATPDAVRAQLAKILQGADPPASEEAVFALLRDAGASEIRVARDEADVDIVRMEAAGCYGRNGADDVCGDALLLSRAVGRPVRVQLSRADEHLWEPKG
ncbi:hypothetical protein M3665_28025, partial [Bacillus licheniformis]|nr:hypothetical protein [Bacillus licheniformis]